ncbi:hypothetical protein D3C73_1226100 [compost metagenome]
MVHCNACMPPRLPPITAAHCATPSESARRAWLCTQSSTVSTGKSAPNGLPVSGLRLLGPVEPLQPPRLFRLTTKNLWVSIGLPGPMQLSHQPGLRSSGL